MTKSLAIATAVAVAIITIAMWHLDPIIYTIGDPGLPRVTVLAGTHGNEPAPAIYLERLARQLSRHPPSGVHLAIVPRVNPRALFFGERGRPDMNRAWPDARGLFTSSLRDLIDGSALVIDLHEAWSFEHRDPGSLGQTVYTTDPHLHPLVERVVRKINSSVYPAAAPALLFRALQKLPETTGGTPLDQYCAAAAIPYILVETAGQDDIQPMPVRIEAHRVALAAILAVA